MLLAHDLAAELVLVALFLLEDLVAPLLEMGKAAVEPARLTAIQPHRVAADALEETAVVRDQDQRRRGTDELFFQPLDDGEIEMVGRLVEQQDIGLGRHDAGKCRAASLATGEIARALLARQAEMVEQVGGAMRVVGRSESSLDIGAHAGEAVHVGGLRQIADRCRWLAKHLAVSRLDHACGNLEQRRLARTVAADERDLVA